MASIFWIECLVSRVVVLLRSAVTLDAIWDVNQPVAAKHLVVKNQLAVAKHLLAVV